MHVSRIALIAALALATAGCSSNSPQAQTLPAQSATPAPAATSATATAAAASSSQLTSELLAVTDLPAGWSTTATSSSSGGAASCKALDSGAWQSLPANAEADFTGGTLGPELAEKLAAGSASQVAAAWQAFTAATAQCASFTTPDSSGGTDKFSLAGLSFPSYGDGTYAFALTVDADGVSASGDVVVVRKGDVLVQIFAVGLTGVPVSVVEDAVGKAVAKA